MGMSEKEFGEMGVQPFFLKLFYFKKQRTEQWQFYAALARLQTYHLINIQLDAKHKLKDPKDLYVYEWEMEPRSTKAQDPQKIAAMVAKAKELMNGI